MDPVGQATDFLQQYGWYLLGGAAIFFFYVRPYIEELSAARSLAAAQDPKRRAALDAKREEIVARRQVELSEAAAKRPPDEPKPKPKKEKTKRQPVVGHNPLMGPGASQGYRPERRRPRGGGG